MRQANTSFGGTVIMASIVPKRYTIRPDNDGGDIDFDISEIAALQQPHDGKRVSFVLKDGRAIPVRRM